MDNEESEEPAMDATSFTLAATHILENIPGPLRKNALSAFNRLCTAAIDIPVAALEGMADEKRAQSLARVRLIETTSDQIARQMHTDPEYARVAVRKFGQKILRERVNIDQIAYLAADELNSPETGTGATDSAEPPPISEDWMNVFEDEAAQMSSEQMQRMFSRILAGEIRKPSSYSIRTVRILAQMDNTVATLFQTLCSLSVSLRIPNADIFLDARVVSLGNASTNSLQAYGLGFDQLNVLQEHGLVISDYNSWMDYRTAIPVANNVTLPVTYLNQQWGLVPISGTTPEPDLKLTGVALSRAGKELLRIVDPTPNHGYTEKLKEHLGSRGFVLVKIGDPNPHSSADTPP